MINKKFSTNWKDFIEFNSKIAVLDKSELLEQDLRIPLTPIKIKAYILYHFFELLYPKFLSDQNNILDIVISNDGRDVLNLYLYETSKAGIHDSFERLPLNIVKYKHKHFKEFDKIFNRFQEDLLKKKNTRISSIRLFKKSAIDLINKYCERIEDLPLSDFILQFLELIQQLFAKDLYFIYPEPIIYQSLKEFITFLNDIHLKSLVSVSYEIIPEFNIALFVTSENMNLIFQLQNHRSELRKPEFKFRVMLPLELGIYDIDLNEKETLEIIQEKLNTENVYCVDQNIILFLLSDLIELTVPLKKENLQFLLQKILFGYRSFEKYWDMTPQPVIYNTFVRFMLRLFGLNLNLRKLSHWAIPDLIFNFFETNFGLNSKVLIILTEVDKYKKINFKKTDYLKAITDHAILLEIENSTLVNLLPLKKDIIFSDGIYNSLDLVRTKVSEEFGVISAIIILDKSIIRNVLKNFVGEHTKLTPLLKLKTLKMLKKPQYFYIYPEIPIYQLIRRKGVLSLLNLLLLIIIDRHEF
ncbi:MAG: hypothetical protein ACFFB0_10325 [Promethearchaeota archaeon]